MRSKIFLLLSLMTAGIACRNTHNEIPAKPAPQRVIRDTTYCETSSLYHPSFEEFERMKQARKNGKSWFFTPDSGSFYKLLKSGESLWIINTIHIDSFYEVWREKNTSTAAGWKVIGMCPKIDHAKLDGDTLRIDGGFACQDNAIIIN